MATVDLDLGRLVSPAYYPMFNSHKRYLAYKGSRGSGKSYATAIKVITDLLVYPYVNWLVVRQYATTQRDSTFSTIRKVAYDMGVGELFKYTTNPLEITYKPTGQKVYFRGMDDALKITSIQPIHGVLCRAWYEEAYELKSESAFETVEESLRGILPDENGYYQTIITFNPWSDTHWLKRVFFDSKSKKRNAVGLTTTYKDNDHLNRDYVESLEDMLRANPNRARVAVKGDWGIAEGLVFEGLFEQKEFSLESIAGLPKSVGLDFGFKHDPTAGEFMAIDQKNRIVYIYDEFYKQHLLTQQIADELGNHKGYGLPVYADSAEQRLITELSRVWGVPSLHPAGKGKGSVIQGVQFMQSYHYVVHPRVKGLLEEFNTYVYDKDKEGNWLNTPKDAANHAIDALRYAMEPFMFIRGGRYMSYQERVNAVKNLGL